MQTEKNPNSIFENFLKKNHLLKVLLVILAFKRMSGIFFFLIPKIKFGQISESTNEAMSGLHDLRKLFMNKFKS